MARQYAKRSENVYRNQLIVNMWHDTGKSLKQIADVFNVSYSTVLNAVHKFVEYDSEVYRVLIDVNERSERCHYSQAVVTRAWMSLKRWYPTAAMSVEALQTTSIGSDVDNNYRITVAVETLLAETQEFLRNRDYITTQGIDAFFKERGRLLATMIVEG